MNILLDIHREKASKALARYGESLDLNYRFTYRLRGDFIDIGSGVREEDPEVRDQVGTVSLESFSALVDDQFWRIIQGARSLHRIQQKALVFVERVPFSLEDLYRNIQKKTKEIYDAMQKYRPSLVVALDITSPDAYLIYLYCKNAGIPYWNLLPLRIGSYLGLSHGPYEDFTERVLSRTLSGDGASKLKAQEFMRQLREGVHAPHDAAQMDGKGIVHRGLRNVERRAFWVLLKTFARAVLAERFRLRRALNRVDLRFALERCRTLIRRSSLYSYQFDPPPMEGSEQSDVLFAWQSEPETAVTLYNPQLPRQFEIAYLLSVAVPKSVKVYVKDHPRMFGLRPRSFYESLKRLNPNIRILDPRLKGSDLIQRFGLIATLSGSVALEASIKTVPCLCLGRFPFSDLPGVIMVENIGLLDDAVRQGLELSTRGDLKDEESEVRRLEILERIFEFGYPISWWSAVDDTSEYDYDGSEFRGFCKWLFEEIRCLKNS